MNFSVSVVIPCFNEKDNIDILYRHLSIVLEAYPDYELIFVDDGSTDDTLETIRSVAEKDPRVRYISLSRNFGHQYALKAGLDHAGGDCVISMDADMQHPPELIPAMIEKWREGYEVVNTIRGDQKSLSASKKLSSGLFYFIINRLSSVEIKPGIADFRLLDRKVVDALKQFSENHLFLRGLIPWMGFRQTSVHFEPADRHKGTTKYTFTRMLRLALDGITSFSSRPLYLSISVGSIIAGIAFLYGIYAVYVHLFTDDALPGWTSITASVLFIGGIQLIMLGIIGIYLGKLFIENKKRPNYIIRTKNF
ncbi:MAG: glycosyltransferase family 2 protein [Bacteroidales bacterium]|nr:glycosyltransferase family 2 protein [Bacteroidales bacterium]MBK9357963.1 glycosyltransferase family 2 protein [Bacteroidales bacterium]